MDELKNSIHEVVKSAVEAADFTKIVDAIAKANAIGKVFIEGTERLTELMDKIAQQIDELRDVSPLLRKQFKMRFKAKKVWNEVFGDMPLRKLAKMSESEFIEAVTEYCQSKIDPWLEAFEKARTKSTNTKDKAPTFDELFTKPEYAEMTLNALRETGIITRLNKWNYGNRKAAICALLAVLKKRTWFNFKNSTYETAKIIADKLGASIGKSTVSDYEGNPPKYTSSLIADFDRLPKD